MSVRAIGIALVLAACSDISADPGEEVYMAHCIACHGRDARGLGPIANELPVGPSDLTRLAVDNGGVFPTARVMEKIYGYPGRYQSDVMPEFGPVLEGPDVAWTDETGATIETPQALLDLRDYLVGIQVE